MSPKETPRDARVLIRQAEDLCRSKNNKDFWLKTIQASFLVLTDTFWKTHTRRSYFGLKGCCDAQFHFLCGCREGCRRRHRRRHCICFSTRVVVRHLPLPLPPPPPCHLRICPKCWWRIVERLPVAFCVPAVAWGYPPWPSTVPPMDLTVCTPKWPMKPTSLVRVPPHPNATCEAKIYWRLHCEPRPMPFIPATDSCRKMPSLPVPSWPHPPRTMTATHIATFDGSVHRRVP